MSGRDPTPCSSPRSPSGDGAYTGAGTVVRDDVPPGALAVSAGPQRNIEGLVETKRPGSAAAEAARKARENPSEAAAEDE